MHIGLRKVIALSSLSLFFAACGDDSTGSKIEYSEKKFESFEDLPACSDSLNTMVAVVGNDRYLCMATDWVKIGGYVKGVCNLDLCSADLDGQYFYAADSKKIYLCNTGTWKTLQGLDIADADYVSCALEAIVRDTVLQKDALEKCDGKHDGNLAKVENDIYACSNKEWVKLAGEVITEGDFPGCSVNGQYVYVLSKMKAYQCNNGAWIENGIPVDVKSSANEPKSSASIPKSSSSKIPSSDSKISSEATPVVSSSSAPFTDDTTKIRGMCLPSDLAPAKGDEVRWMFINMGGTPVSFDWKFASPSPVASSNKVSPTISYTRGGVYKASLIVNKGLPSESELVCSSLSVTGDIPISGCKCTTAATIGVASVDNPYVGEWKVTGCEGGEPFSYEWGNDAFGEGAVGTSATMKVGDYAPSVTVYNDDGVSMRPTCPTVYTYEPLKASCSVDDFSINIRVTNYPSGLYGAPAVNSIPAEYILDGSEPVSISLFPYSNGLPYNSQNNNQFHEFVLLGDGDTICTAFSHLSCSVDNISVGKNEPVQWSLSSLDGFEVKSVSWSFADGNDTKTTSKEISPINSFDAYGRVYANVLINEGTAYEHTVSCNTMVEYPTVTGCECGEPELVSATNDLALLEDVRYKWTVTGCKTSEDAAEFTYGWDEYSMAPKLEDEPANSKTYVFDYFGLYGPKVYVYNKYGRYELITCPSAEVIKSEIENSSSSGEDSSSSEVEESSDSEPAEDSSSSEVEESSDSEPAEDSSSSSDDPSEAQESSDSESLEENDA